MISQDQRDSWSPESEGATANDGEQLRRTENNENMTNERWTESARGKGVAKNARKIGDRSKPIPADCRIR